MTADGKAANPQTEPTAKAGAEAAAKAAAKAATKSGAKGTAKGAAKGATKGATKGTAKADRKKATGPSQDLKDKFRAALDAKHPTDTHGVAGAGGPRVRDSEVHGPRRTFRRKSG